MKSQIVQGTENHTSQISISKINAVNTVALSKVSVHNGRTGKTEQHVDQRRTRLNDIMIGAVDTQFYRDIINRVTGRSLSKEEANKIDKSELRYKDGTKIRSNAVLAFECKCQYPGDLIYANIDAYGQIQIIPEGEEIDPRPIEDGGKGDFLYPADMEEFKKWKELTLQYVGNKFGGNDNIMQAICHMDEGIPHLHIVGTPVYKNKDNIEHLSMRNFLNGKKEFAALQTEYAMALSELGYKRGREFGYNVNSSTATQARALMGQAIASAPQTPEEYEQLIAGMTSKEGMEHLQALHLKAALETKLAEEVPKLEALVRIKKKENEHLRQELQEEKNKNTEYQKQLAVYQKEYRRRLCELQGIQMSSDKELVEAYLDAQEHYIDCGREIFERAGNFADLDFGEKEPEQIDD